MKYLQLYEGFKTQVQDNYERSAKLHQQEQELAEERNKLDTQVWHWRKQWLQQIGEFVYKYGTEHPTAVIEYRFDYPFERDGKPDILRSVFWDADWWLSRTLASEEDEYENDGEVDAPYGYNFEDDGCDMVGVVMDAILEQHPEYLEGQEMGFFLKEALSYQSEQYHDAAKLLTDYVEDINYEGFDYRGWGMAIEPHTNSWGWAHHDYDYYVYATPYWDNYPTISLQITTSDVQDIDMYKFEGQNLDLDWFLTTEHHIPPVTSEQVEQFIAKYLQHIKGVLDFIMSDDFQAFREGGEMGFFVREK